MTTPNCNCPCIPIVPCCASIECGPDSDCEESDFISDPDQPSCHDSEEDSECENECPEIPGPQGPLGLSGPQGPAGFGLPPLMVPQAIPEQRRGISRFYGMTSGIGNSTTTDYATNVPSGAAVPFPRDGFVSGGIVRNSPSSFILPSIGTYKINWTVQTNESGQLQLDLDEGKGRTVVYTSTIKNQNPNLGDHLFVGNDILSTTVNNAIVRVINSAANYRPVTIVHGYGASTHANVQSLLIEQVL